MSQVVSCQPVSTKASIQSQARQVVFVDTVAVGQGFLQVPMFSHVSIIPPTLHTHSFISLPYTIFITDMTVKTHIKKIP